MKFYHDYHSRAKQKLRKLRRLRQPEPVTNNRIRNGQEYELWRWLKHYMGLG